MTPSSHRRRHRHYGCKRCSRSSSTSNATPQTSATGTSSRDGDGRICCTTRRCSRGRRHAPPPPHRRGPTSPRKWHAVSSRHPNTFPANIARRSLHPRSRIAILTLSSSSPLTREKAARWRMPRRSTATDGTAPTIMMCGPHGNAFAAMSIVVVPCIDLRERIHGRRHGRELTRNTLGEEDVIAEVASHR